MVSFLLLSVCMVTTSPLSTRFSSDLRFFVSSFVMLFFLGTGAEPVFFLWGGGGVHLGSEYTYLLGVRGHALPGKFSDCLRLHFTRFHGGERECRVVKRKSQSQAPDHLKI